MKLLLASVAALAIFAGSASAQTLVLGTAVNGGTEAIAGSSAGAGTFSLGNGFAATAQRNTTTSGANTAIVANGGLQSSSLAGASNAGTQSTSSGIGASLGGAGSIGGSTGSGSAQGFSQGFGGFGFTFP